MKKIKILIPILLLFCGCKNIEKATNRVIDNPTAFNKVGIQWAAIHPCVNDTVVKSKSDTVTVTNTAYLSGDTVTVGDTVRITKTLQNTVLKYIHDTVTNNITDKRAVNMVSDSLNYYKGLLIQQKAATDTALKAVKDMKKDRNKWRLWFWLLVAGVGVYVFRKPIIGLITKVV